MPEGLLPDLPNIDATLFNASDLQQLLMPKYRAEHLQRFLLLYGSVRERSCSRLLTNEAARILRALGGEVHIFDPSGLPLPDNAPDPTLKYGSCVIGCGGPKAWPGSRPSATAP